MTFDQTVSGKFGDLDVQTDESGDVSIGSYRDGLYGYERLAPMQALDLSRVLAAAAVRGAAEAVRVGSGETELS